MQAAVSKCILKYINSVYITILKSKLFQQYFLIKQLFLFELIGLSWGECITFEQINVNISGVQWGFNQDLQ